MSQRILALALAACGLAAAQGQRPPAGPAVFHEIKPGIYWVSGGAGANTGVIVGKKEVVLIDAKMTVDSAKEILAGVAKITPLPVKTIVLTHSDGDHVNGLPGYPAGLHLVSHENSRGHMEAASKEAQSAALAQYLPTDTLQADRDLKVDGVRIRLLHFGPAHTNGDLVVFLPEQKVAFVGDLIFLGRDPLIHQHKNGSFAGALATLEKFLTLDADTFISGHADPAGKAEIQGLLTGLKDKQAKVKALIGEGKSLEQIKAALNVPESASPQRRPGLIDAIYKDLTEKK